MSEMRFDRRRLLVVGGSGVLATVLAACGSGSGGASSGGGASAAAAALDPATEQGKVTVFDWAGYEIPAFWSQYEKGPYGKSNPLKFTFLENDQQALAKVAAGFTPDMAHPCIAYAKDWADAGLIQPWDTKLLPEYNDLRPNMRAAGVVDGKPYAIPWDWGFSSIAYRADRVHPQELSWNLYLDSRYKGRMSLYNDGATVIKIGGLLNGVADPNKMTQKDIDAAKATMIKAAANVRNFWGSEPDTINDFVNGNIDATYAWPGTWYQIKNHPKMKGVPVEYMQPKEGRLAWICSYVLIKDTPRAGLAHQVMKAGLSVPAMSALTNQYLYGASNASPAVIAHVKDKTLVKAFGLDDPHSLDPPGVWLEHYLPNRVDYVKAFQEVQAAAGA